MPLNFVLYRVTVKEEGIAQLVECLATETKVRGSKHCMDRHFLVQNDNLGMSFTYKMISVLLLTFTT
jgi:hypothetical protein